MVLLAFINASGSAVVLPKIKFMSFDEAFFYIGIGNFYWLISMLFAFLGMCIGIISITNERSNGSLRVLMTKPIYRRDVVIGKIFGISSLLFALISFTLILFISLMMVTTSNSAPILELFLRVGIFDIILLINSIFTLSLVMLFGITLKKAEALVLSLGYISFEWLSQTYLIPVWLGDLQILNPMNLFVHATSIHENDLFMITIPFTTWLNNALPYILMLIVETLIIILLNCILFNREEM